MPYRSKSEKILFHSSLIPFKSFQPERLEFEIFDSNFIESVIFHLETNYIRNEHVQCLISLIESVRLIRLPSQNSHSEIIIVEHLVETLSGVVIILLFYGSYICDFLTIACLVDSSSDGRNPLVVWWTRLLINRRQQCVIR